MNKKQQYQTNAFTRVQQFFGIRAASVGALAESEGKKQLDTAQTEIGALGVAQEAAVRAMAGSQATKQSLNKELRVQHMKPIAAFARTRLRGAPGYAALSTAKFMAGESLVRAARAMATAAVPYNDVLVQNGFPADTLATLGSTADALEASIVSGSNAKATRAGSTARIGQQIALGREAVAMLNAVIIKQFAGDPGVLADWKLAKTVTKKPGTVRVSAVPSVSTAAPAPAPTAVATSTPVASAL